MFDAFKKWSNLVSRLLLVSHVAVFCITSFQCILVLHLFSVFSDECWQLCSTAFWCIQFHIFSCSIAQASDQLEFNEHDLPRLAWLTPTRELIKDRYSGIYDLYVENQVLCHPGACEIALLRWFWFTVLQNCQYGRTLERFYCRYLDHCLVRRITMHCLSRVWSSFEHLLALQLRS